MSQSKSPVVATVSTVTIVANPESLATSNWYDTADTGQVIGALLTTRVVSRESVAVPPTGDVGSGVPTDSGVYTSNTMGTENGPVLAPSTALIRQ